MMQDLIRYLPMLARGALTTGIVWFCASTISIFIGSVLGILNCNRLKRPLINSLINGYVILMKGVPLFVLLLLSYFVIPQLLGINIAAIYVATVTLGLCSAGYVTEIVRGGINSIPSGQWEACIVLGYNTFNILWRVILPQMIQNALPTLIGELDQIIKSTAVFATIGVVELTKTAMNIVARELNPLPIYLSIACFYLFISIMVNMLGKKIEQRISHGNR